MEKVDYLVIGAGLIGSSVAMHLSGMLGGKKSVAVVDVDLEGVFSSSERNAGGVRTTWDQKVNADLARDSIDFFAKHKEQTNFEACGYLWLFSPEQWEKARQRAEKSNSRGFYTEGLSVKALRERVPFLDKTEDLRGAIFSPKDGLLNPNLTKNFYRKRARGHGALFLDGHRVVGVESKSEKIVVDFDYCPKSSEDSVLNFLTGGQTEYCARKQIGAQVVVNCAGAWASNLGKLMGYDRPSWPVRRQVSVFNNPAVDMQNYGMIVDSSGVYFHKEADNIIGGFADLGEKKGFHLDYDGAAFFEEKIWTALYGRSSKFESLKHITGWGGLYAMTPDCSPIIGKVNNCIYEAHGFSGRGAMQSYAAGRGLAEHMVLGSYQTIDLHCLRGQRFAENELVVEGLHI